MPKAISTRFFFFPLLIHQIIWIESLAQLSYLVWIFLLERVGFFKFISLYLIMHLICLRNQLFTIEIFAHLWEIRKFTQCIQCCMKRKSSGRRNVYTVNGTLKCHWLYKHFFVNCKKTANVSEYFNAKIKVLVLSALILKDILDIW